MHPLRAVAIVTAIFAGTQTAYAESAQNGGTDAAQGTIMTMCDHVEDGFCRSNQADFFDETFRKLIIERGDQKDILGGFGGGDDHCIPVKTPIVFIHGNSDSALGWDDHLTGESLYHFLIDKKHYQPCELFGLTYLDEYDIDFPSLVVHNKKKYDRIIKFILLVKEYVAKRNPQITRVDIVAHSLGVTMAMAAFSVKTDHCKNDSSEDGCDPVNFWDNIAHFINIGGGVRGLASCSIQNINPIFYAAMFSYTYYNPTCGSIGKDDPTEFGFTPNGEYGVAPDGPVWTLTKNTWTDYLRSVPQLTQGTDFFTIEAGLNDQLHCIFKSSGCEEDSLFDNATNVRAQLDIGRNRDNNSCGDGDSSEGWKPDNACADWIGHLNIKNKTGEIIYKMLNSNCRGLECRGEYDGVVNQVQ